MKVKFRSITLFAVSVCLLSGVIACKSEKKTNCADDFACSYLLLSLRPGDLSVSITGITNTVVSVSVYDEAGCKGNVVKSDSLVYYSNSNSTSKTFVTFQGISSTPSYSVQASFSSKTLCSASTVKFSATNTTKSCTISNSTVDCL